MKDSRIVSIRLPAALVDAAEAAAKHSGSTRHRLLQLVLIAGLTDLLPPADR